MRTKICPRSKANILAITKRAMRGLMLGLAEIGFSYPEIEKELRLEPKQGGTVFECIKKWR
jgi:hypothetical protein